MINVINLSKLLISSQTVWINQFIDQLIALNYIVNMSIHEEH